MPKSATCVECGAPLGAKDRFCPRCGRAVAPPSAGLTTRAATQAWLRSYRRQKRAWGWIFFLLVLPIVLGAIWIAAGEFSKDVLYGVAGFVVVTGLLTLYSSRQTNKAWQGTVVDKAVREVTVGDGEDDVTELQHYLTVEQAEGLRHEFVVNEAAFSHFELGDRAVKVAGADFPAKLDPDPRARMCILCGAVFDAQASHCPRCRAPAVDGKNLL